MSKGLHAMQLPPQQAAMATGELHAAGKSQRAAICLLHVAASGTQVVFLPFCIGYNTSSSSRHVSTQSLRSNAMKPPVRITTSAFYGRSQERGFFLRARTASTSTRGKIQPVDKLF